MDVFVEQIVKKQSKVKDKLIAVGIMLGAFIISFVAMFILPALVDFLASFSIFFVAGAFYGAYWLISNRNLEFEYAVTNGDITVDKIIARRRRKRMVTVDAKNIEAMGKYKIADHVQKSYDKRIVAARDDAEEDTWFVSFRHGSLGNVLLVFSPDERTLGAVKPFLKRQVALDAFGRDAFNRH